MKINCTLYIPAGFQYKIFLLFSCFLAYGSSFGQAPANDNCANAIEIAVPNAGFGLGTFTSAQTNLTNATVQTTETFAPAIFGAGLDKKSVWYKFSIATIRAVRVTFTQPGTTITAGDAGFSVYQTSSCVPANANISTKLTPIVTFGNTYHPCVPSGEYLIQVSSNFNANGPVIVQVEISDQTGAAYDHPNQAYAFGTAGYYARKIDFNTECQSIEDATEVCSAFANPADYNKSAWLTFKTPSYFDYLIVQLSGTGTSTYFPSNNGLATQRKFGYTLYKGDAVTTPIGSLVTIDGCDSLVTDGYYAAHKVYKCNDLDTGTVYSIQLFIQKDFSDDVRLGILTGGQQPTRGPKPVLADVPAPNAVGVLPNSPAGILTSVTDVWGCNSRHNTSNCSPSLPDSGIVYNGGKYNLSSFFTFTLTNTAAVSFYGYVTQCGTQPLIRVFKQGLTNSCNGLDTSNIIGTFIVSGTIDCLEAGNYTVQVSGQDYTQPVHYFNYGTPLYNYEQCLSNNLGAAFQLNMTGFSRKAANKYRLDVTGAFDTINRVGAVMEPLVAGIPYAAVSDTMGCENTVRPADTTCSPLNNKVIYRQFSVSDSGTADFSNLGNYANTWRYRLYSGDANALASAQNVFSFPDKVNGLVPKSECMDSYVTCYNKSVCVTPGTYTLTTMGSDANVGTVDKPTITFFRTRTKYSNPLAAQDMGSIMDTLGVNGGTIKSDIDVWSCDDNAVEINGIQPCTVGGKPATKAIYRQFYLKDPALVQIQNTYYWYCNNMAYGTKTLFYGKVTDGLNNLSPVGNAWSCFPYSAGTTAGCNLLPAGWYTVVSYNQGPSYDSTVRNLYVEGRYNSSIGYRDEFNITITPTCPGPKFNRPYKASVNASSQPHLLQWGNRVTSTPAYPRTDTIFTLPTETFNCTLDTPFTSHPVVSCEAAANRVVYYVFRTTQESFIQINTGGYFAQLFDKDVRIDSADFATATPIQYCNSNSGYIQFCFFQPGTYTLVVFAKDANICQSVTPSIYIDKVGYSRFDYAANAYDFAVVPPDSVWHTGKVGDVNPLNSGRAASSDFIFCTTGATETDPAQPVCNTKINPNVYDNGPNKSLYDSAFPPFNGVARRNLWYTFVVDQPGYVKVKVENKTIGHAYQPKFAVYSSNVEGSLPFSTVQSSGEVDSTAQQGLTHIVTNYTWYYCSNSYNEVSFYRDPCSAVTNRYYLLVENVNAEPYESAGTLPNTQIDVSVLVDSINLVLPKHDKHYQAGDFGNVGVGTFQGDVDNYSCATRNATDPLYYYTNCQKTLWYKFTPTITGNVRYRVYINGTRQADYYHVQLFRESIPGDSTSNGLKIQTYAGAYGSDNTYWAQTCVSPGTYYILITGCDQVNAYVYPEIELIEAVGDFCSRAVASAINGPGAVTTTVLVNCHTIATDYGEFGPQLTCPQGANTVEYKSSWFRMDIGGTDTLDVTAYLVENTNASSSDIKYRLMTGDCGAMQEQSCVQDALTQNTYQCLVPGQSYYVQVFTPVTKFNQPVTGTIDLKLSAVAHADTCAPLTNCLATANFTTLFDCNTDESVKFVNFSTYGTSIIYNWNFGYNGQTSSEVSPAFFYPALPNDTVYSVKLVIENVSCGKKDSVTRTVAVPGRPYINLGNDIARCDGAPITLTTTSHSGATYQWQNGTVADTLAVTATGNNEYWVKVDYNGCSNADTVRVVISNITPKPLQNIILCADSVSISVSRGQGETYLWNTGATTASIYVSTPGVYWADVRYFTCTYRDSFFVNNVNTAQPLGNDTTVCITPNGYTLRATTAGAQSYSWNNGTTADTLKIAMPGQYSVTINFGSCTVADTVDIGGYPAAVTQNTDTSFCSGSSLTLPWGLVINAAGIYNDTLRYVGGCDSLIRKVTVTVNPKPQLANDTTVCLAQNPFVLNATVPGALSYQWQDGSADPTFGVTAPGLYWVLVNFGSCSTADSINISGSPAPAIITRDTSICSGISFTLPWGPVINAAGTYRDTIASQSGCDSVITVVNLTVNSSPSLGNDMIANTCSGIPYDLTAAFVTTGLSTNWILGGAPVTDPSGVTAAGNYQLVALNGNGCADTAVLTLSINPKPALGNDTAVNICEGTIFNLTTLYNTNNLVTNWTINNTAVANPAAVNVNGPYQLIAMDNFGCADTAVVILTADPGPALGNDAVITVCPGTAVDLTAIYSTTGLATAWTYNFAAVSNPAAVTAAGDYRLVGISAAGCSDTAIVTIVFNASPSLGNDTTVAICEGNRYDLTSLYNTTNLSPIWSINNAVFSTPSAAAVAGVYSLSVTNSFGCADTALVTLLVNSKPFLGNDTAVAVCNGNNVDLTILYSTVGFTTSWTFNAIPVSNPATVSVQGNYQLIVTTTSGCMDTALVALTVNPKPVLGNDTAVTICQGITVDLTAMYTTAGLAASWTLNGNVVSNPAAVAISGSYRLIGSTVFGCSDTAVVTVTVNPKPVLGNDTSVAICQVNSFNLTTIYNTGNNSNSWSEGGSPVANPSVVNSPGNYQLISTAPSGCADTAIVTLSVTANPTVVITDPATICLPLTANLSDPAVTAGSTAGLSYSYWQDPGATLVFSDAAAAMEGVYYIKGTNSTGCFDIKPVTVSVYPLPVVTGGNDVGICDRDSSAVLNAVVSNSTVPVTYQWEPAVTGGIESPLSASTLVKPSTTPQQYIVTVTDGYGCNYLVSDTVMVTKQPPVPAFAGNDTIAVVGLPHQLMASGGANYIWSPDNVLNNPYIANPLATMTADSTLFAVTVIDIAGCRGYDSVWVKTYDGITFYVPNAFSPNGDGINDVFRPIPVGIVSTDLFRIFNRYGQLVFETNQWMKGWDGTYKGVAQAVGNYVWIVKGKGRNGKIIEMKGNVVLVR
jgi:gliding motility-associated-like protein